MIKLEMLSLSSAQNDFNFLSLRHTWSGGSIHNGFIFFCFSGTLGLEVKNTSGTAKVLGSKLAGPVFFFKREISVSKKCRPIVCLLMVCWLSCHIVDFFCCTRYTWYVLSALIYFCCWIFFNLDFVSFLCFFQTKSLVVVFSTFFPFFCLQ